MKPFTALIWNQSFWGQAVWGPVSQRKTHTMGQVVLNLNGLSVPEQIGKGDDAIEKSTNNPKVTGNADELAEFVTAHTALGTVHTACESARTTAKAKTAERKAALKTWKAKLKALAAKTEDLTEGLPADVLSAGFELKSQPTPPQPLEAPMDLHVATNGTPGMSELDWTPPPGAVSFLVETCADPITPEGWEQIATPTKAACKVNGAEPGKKRWYRVAGVNALGQGPWSEPEARPVM